MLAPESPNDFLNSKFPMVQGMVKLPGSCIFSCELLWITALHVDVKFTTHFSTKFLFLLRMSFKIQIEVTTLSLTPTCHLIIHQHSGTMRISHMKVEHHKVKDLGRIFNNIMLYLGSNNNNNSSNKEVRE